MKVIGSGLAAEPGYRQRFAREARTPTVVSGLYIASVVDADTEGEHPHIATEFVAAPSLAEPVKTAGPLPAASVFALAAGPAEALAAIHRAGLVHRDVKPHNILLAADGPVVIDFGIALGDGTALTATGTTTGTAGYIAPEVLGGHDPTSASEQRLPGRRRSRHRGPVDRGSDGTGSLGLSMWPGTNPAITGLGNGTYEIALQGSNGNLWTDGSLGTGDTTQAMWHRSSPAITALPPVVVCIGPNC